MLQWRTDSENYGSKNAIPKTGENPIFEAKSISVFPYELNGEITREEECLFFDYEFTNKQDKVVKTFDVMMYLSDENGEIPLKGKNFLHLEISQDFNGCSFEKGRTDITEFFRYVPEEVTVEFLHVSRLSYEDGSIWENRISYK